MKLELPWPPSVGNYWGQRVISKPGRKPFVMMYLKPRAKQFQQKVNQIWNYENYEPFQDRRVAVRIAVHPPNRRKFDLDNLCKSILDAMTYVGAWEDDEQIDDLHLMRGEIVPDGCVIVEVTELKTGENGGGT